eukprot:TRINITY_DN3154_c0_g1_i4.p1 TRINITY_DN3154_c0_g1~~TRINITY_DN3154_c0_g1_i4.p1  ORF type:complete len:303 (+),score=61.12 TRINITY_DN3154_c0_g1_i4:515-1423(+)
MINSLENFEIVSNSGGHFQLKPRSGSGRIFYLVCEDSKEKQNWMNKFTEGKYIPFVDIQANQGKTTQPKDECTVVDNESDSKNSGVSEQVMATAFPRETETCGWSEFKGILEKNLIALPSEIDQLKDFCVGEKENVVEKEKWNKLCDRFSPLVREGDSGEKGYTISEIASIIGPAWFINCSSTTEAQEILNKHPQKEDNWFLVRFSSTTGCFTVSAKPSNRDGQMTEWRITRKKRGEFEFEGQPFVSMREIILRIVKKPLVCGLGPGDILITCQLSKSCSRKGQVLIIANNHSRRDLRQQQG